MFLEKVQSDLARNDTSQNVVILLDYLKSVTPAENDHTSDSLPELFQAWRFASQTAEHGLLSAIPNALALLLKTISLSIDFQKAGSRLCRTLLSQENLMLLDRGLSASVAHDHLIKSTLVLLCQIVCFDGGSHARGVYNQRDITFKKLESFLGMRQRVARSANSTDNSPSLRQCALDYLLANLRFQDNTAKADLLSLPKLGRSLFGELIADSAKSIEDLFEGIRGYVLQDEKLVKIAKIRLLNEIALKQILKLFQFGEDQATNDSGSTRVPQLAHDFLKLACTSKHHGIVIKQYAWYPPGTESLKAKIEGETETTYNFGHFFEQAEQYKSSVPVKNTTLASFLHDLRPWAHSRERDLALSIVRAVPELIADYMKRKRTFPVDPKLSVTWIGYFTFLSSVIDLPLPEIETSIEGEVRTTPSISIVMESILPSMFSQKVLKKCLNQDSRLIQLLAIRFLINSFRKMRRLSMRYGASKVPLQWRDMLSRVLTEFQSKVPDLNFIQSLYKGCSQEADNLKEALACLVSLYYELAPPKSEGQKLDVSTHIVDMLHEWNTKSLSGTQEPLPFELDNLLMLADYSFSSHWWQKSGKSDPSTRSKADFSYLSRKSTTFTIFVPYPSRIDEW